MRDFSGLKLGAIGVWVFVIGGFLVALGGRLLGMTIAILGFAITVGGFVVHALIMFDRKKTPNDESDSEVD
jgi:hypothetical protein